MEANEIPKSMFQDLDLGMDFFKRRRFPCESIYRKRGPEPNCSRFIRERKESFDNDSPHDRPHSITDPEDNSMGLAIRLIPQRLSLLNKVIAKRAGITAEMESRLARISDHAGVRTGGRDEYSLPAPI
jgi:hypothetical protein